LGQQVGFARELDEVIALAHRGGPPDESTKKAIVDAWAGLQSLRHQALRTLDSDASSSTGVEANVNKLMWANWHRSLGELAFQVAGPEALIIEDDGLTPLQNLFLFTRSDTIYGGSNEVQRNVIAERHWKLPRDTYRDSYP